MPPRNVPFGSDTLPASCCLATGYDDPAFIDWRRDHPEWFAAGTWTTTAGAEDPTGSDQSTPVASRTGDDPPGGGQRADDQPRPSRVPTVGMGRSDRPALDPATISLADFHDVVGRAKGGFTGSAAPRNAELTPSPDPPDPDAPA